MQHKIISDLKYKRDYNMQTTKPLNEIPINIKVTISEICVNPGIKTRYYEIGFIPGSEITMILESPLKNPKAYLINGYVIAIRNEEANNIKVIIDW